MSDDDLELLTLQQLHDLIADHEQVVFSAPGFYWRVHFQEPDNGGRAPVLYIGVLEGVFELHAESGAGLNDHKVDLCDALSEATSSKATITPAEFGIATSVHWPAYLTGPFDGDGDASPLQRRAYIMVYRFVEAWCRIFNLTE